MNIFPFQPVINKSEKFIFETNSSNNIIVLIIKLSYLARRDLIVKDTTQ